ncbi:hypothetical protein M422DRAFT_271279, partial [Sphaerobolus stellatus SS14]
MAGVHPIHRAEATYGQPEIHVSYPANGGSYAGYNNHNPDEDPDHESLTGERKEDTDDWHVPQDQFEIDVLMDIGIHPNEVRWKPVPADTRLPRPPPRTANEER